jgi:hypothetical protein
MNPLIAHYKPASVTRNTFKNQQNELDAVSGTLFCFSVLTELQ